MNKIFRGKKDIAEDEANAQDLEDTSRPSTRGQKQRQQQQRKKPVEPAKKTKCRPRIDQLAIPNRRLIFALYQGHASHLPKDKVEKIKVLLQELYAMTPEETEKYFEHLRDEAQEVEKRKAIKHLLKKLVKKRQKRKQIKQAHEFVLGLLVKGMRFAAKHQMPPVMSVRLRNMSDIILEQICDLRNVTIPSRDKPDEMGRFLIQVADWMAVSVEHLYYGVQLRKNEEMEKIEKEFKQKKSDVEKKPDRERDETPLELEEPEDGIISDPVLMYDME